MLKAHLVSSVLAGALVFSGLRSSAFAASVTPTITSLTLIDSTTQKDLRPLASSDTIDLARDDSALNIRVNTAGVVGAVEIFLDGKSYRVENGAPYGIGPAINSVYSAWALTVGSHTLKAVPYMSRNRGGMQGAAYQISLTVTKSAVASSASATGSSSVLSLPLLQQPIYLAPGQLNLSLYGTLALSQDKLTMEAKLGPAFLDLNPLAADDRPLNYQPTSKNYSGGYARVNPWELGTKPSADSDYWSDSGQVAYIPDNASDPGLDRIQTFAYYDKVFAISPRLDWPSGQPHPEVQTRDPYYVTLFGEAPKYPIAMVRNYGMQQNEALVLYRDGNLGVAGTQTSRASNERPYPGFVFPADKVPTGIAVTTANEFALVTVWDVTQHKGQLAVLALEGKYLPFHTWPYMGLPNQGSWSAFKLLGYIDLPMSMPTSVSAASNGWWSGPSQTGGDVLSQIDLSHDGYRNLVYSGAWSGVVATGGYAIVASKYDNTVAVVDLQPLFSYIRESYLSSAASYNATLAARGTADTNFPQAFSVKPSIMPKVVWQASVTSPTAVLAGMKMDRWTSDYFKAYVAAEDGTIDIIDVSPLMKRNSWEKLGSLRIAGSFNVGKNPVSMCFTRRGEGSKLPLLPILSDGSQSNPDPLNNLFYVAVRGERKVVAAVTFGGQGAVYRTIKDKRMQDPVAVSCAVRGPIVSVADFRGRQVVSFRVGKIYDLRNNVTYGPGADGNADFEFAGSLPVAGYPFLLNSTNVN